MSAELSPEAKELLALYFVSLPTGGYKIFRSQEEMDQWMAEHGE